MEQIILDTRKMNYSSIMHDYLNKKDYEIIGDKEELIGILNTNLCESNIEERVKEYYKKALDDFICTNARDNIDRIVEYIANMSKYGLEILNELKLIDYCESVSDPYGNCEPEPGRLIIDRKALIAYRDRKCKEWNDMFKDSVDEDEQDDEETLEDDEEENKELDLGKDNNMNRNKDEITESNYRLVKKEPYPSANGHPGGIIYHFHSDKTNDSYKMFIDDEGDVGLVI